MTEVATHTPASTATAWALIRLKLHLKFCCLYALDISNWIQRNDSHDTLQRFIVTMYQ